MPENHFKTNRNRIQRAALTDVFLKPLTKADLPYIITETKNEEGGGKLRSVTFENIPISGDYQLAHVLDMELEKSVFTKPHHYKTVEKAILIFSAWSLHVILIEMKNKIAPYGDAGIKAIQSKIIDSVGRVGKFLSHYLLDVDRFDDYPINYFSFIVHTSEGVTTAVVDDKTLGNEPLYKVMKGDRDAIDIVDTFGIKHKVKVNFFRSNEENYTIDLNDVFNGNEDFENAIYSDKELI